MGGDFQGFPSQQKSRLRELFHSKVLIDITTSHVFIWEDNFSRFVTVSCFLSSHLLLSLLKTVSPVNVMYWVMFCVVVRGYGVRARNCVSKQMYLFDTDLWYERCSHLIVARSDEVVSVTEIIRERTSLT